MNTTLPKSGTTPQPLIERRRRWSRRREFDLAVRQVETPGLVGVLPDPAVYRLIRPCHWNEENPHNRSSVKFR